MTTNKSMVEGKKIAQEQFRQMRGESLERYIKAVAKIDDPNVIDAFQALCDMIECNRGRIDLLEMGEVGLNANK